MAPETTLEKWLLRPAPLLALAPMQDVTDLPFWQLLSRYGGPDVYYTEYFRVYATSVLEKRILRSIEEHPTGHPVIAQLIGNDIPSLVRSARQLQEHPIAGIDLNLGCPAPVVYRKCAGGGLLRDPKLVDRILGALREVIQTHFSVKTRIGFDSTDHFEEFLVLFAKHSVDLVTVHARTVREMYRSEVHYEFIARAASALPCPVLANGNVYSARKALDVAACTGARGVMIGRGAIRNPWIFRQVRELQRGEKPYIPRGHEVLAYVRDLYEAVSTPDVRESSQVQRMKKYMNYLGLGVDAAGDFLHGIRRVTTRQGFFEHCQRFLAHDHEMPLEPFRLSLSEADLLAGEHH